MGLWRAEAKKQQLKGLVGAPSWCREVQGEGALGAQTGEDIRGKKRKGGWGSERRQLPVRGVVDLDEVTPAAVRGPLACPRAFRLWISPTHNRFSTQTHRLESSRNARLRAAGARARNPLTCLVLTQGSRSSGDGEPRTPSSPVSQCQRTCPARLLTTSHNRRVMWALPDP